MSFNALCAFHLGHVHYSTVYLSCVMVDMNRQFGERQSMYKKYSIEFYGQQKKQMLEQYIYICQIHPNVLLHGPFIMIPDTSGCQSLQKENLILKYLYDQNHNNGNITQNIKIHIKF